MRRSTTVLAAVLAGCATSPTLIAEAPQTSTAPAKVALRGLPPGAEVRLTMERPYDWDAAKLQRSITTYRADGRGRIDTAVDAPVAGGFDRVDPYGLFWTAKPLDEPAPPGATPSDAVIRADIDGDGGDDLTAALTLPFGHGAVTEDPLGPAFPGAFVMRPKGTDGERLPVIVALGGSGGGDGAVRFAAPRLAHLGYAVLGLPYYSPAWFGRDAQFPDLPRDFVDLPVDYIEAGIAALRQRPDIDPDRIALHGVSKGGELALLAGSLIPDDSPGGGYCAVAAIVPSDVVWEGWGDSSDDENGSSGFSWRGEALPFVPYEDIQRAFSTRGTEDAVPLRVPHDEGRNANPDRARAAMIDVQAIVEPVYALGGDADRTWDSGGMVRNIAARRGGLPTVALAFEQADHGLSGTAYRPATPGTAAARTEAWPKLVAFLEEHLSAEGCADARVPAPTATAAEAAYRQIDADWFERDLPSGSVAAALKAVLHGDSGGAAALVQASSVLPDTPLKTRLARIAVGEYAARFEWLTANAAADRLGAADLRSDWMPVRAAWPTFSVDEGGPAVAMVAYDGLRIPGTLNGEPVMIAFDTGAPGVGVDRELAARTGLRVDRSVAATSSIPAFGVTLPKHPALIDTLEIGGVMMRNVPANTGGAIPPDQQAAFDRMKQILPPNDVIMGLDALRQAFDVVEFDYARDVVRLVRADESEPALPTYIHGSGLKPVVRVHRNGEAVNAYLDTGSYGHILGPDSVDPACAASRTFERDWGAFTEYRVPLRLAGSPPFEAWVSRGEFAVDRTWDVTGVFGIPRSGVLRVDMADRAVSLSGYDVAEAVYAYEPVRTVPPHADCDRTMR